MDFVVSTNSGVDKFIGGIMAYTTLFSVNPNETERKTTGYLRGEHHIVTGDPFHSQCITCSTNDLSHGVGMLSFGIRTC